VTDPTPPPPRPPAPPQPPATTPAAQAPGDRFWTRVLTPVGVVVLAFALTIPLASLLFAADLSDDSVNAIFAATGGALIAVLGLAALNALPAHERRLATAVKHSRSGAVGLGLVIGIGVVIGSVAIIGLGTLVDPSLEERLEEQATEVGPAAWQVALLVIALVVLAPLGEELVFRGLLLRGLARRLSFWPAAAISAVLFAAAHVDAYVLWPRAIALVITGLVLAWLYRWRGYWAAVVAHATVNGVAATALVAAG